MIEPTGLLLTDLYQLAMMEAYHAGGMSQEAVFEFFVRDLPPGYGYLVAAGLPQVLEWLGDACFTREELDWMESSGRFGRSFIASLRDFRFTGSVHALREGTLFFPGEPVLRVTAPIQQAQLVETRIINLLQYQIMVATKAARCVTAAPGKLLLDFGLRRAHGAEAGLLAARASYLGGFMGSATVLAAPYFEVPIYGTMAHSFIEAHDDEIHAFERFARSRPDQLVLLIDTYDTELAAQRLIPLAKRLAVLGIHIQGVRLDSGDLAWHAAQVRGILDAGGLGSVRIFVSGGLDEYRVRALLASGAPIDGFGIGSKLDTSAGVSYLDCAYKLVEYAGIPRRKHSEEKRTWPGRKQVLRRYDSKGAMVSDRLTLDGESGSGTPLLELVMERGVPVGPILSLEQARAHLSASLNRLPEGLAELDADPSYPIEVSAEIQDLARRTDAMIARRIRN